MKSYFSRYLLFGLLGIAFALYIYIVLSFITVNSIGLSLLSFVLIGIGALCIKALLSKLLLGQESKSGKFQTTFYCSFGICAILALFVI
ncbi:hypothetical protein [Bacillus sp. FJAT-45037]|uniref:hypothetical protein n=1 Tax=Bacillus sp. FJAT-45037 TaxID=2011007 RepID=UPI000C24AF8E|nr:hypothetical protein [Bacillus sp. FJAT-45037]